MITPTANPVREDNTAVTVRRRRVVRPPLAARAAGNLAGKDKAVTRPRRTLNLEPKLEPEEAEKEKLTAELEHPGKSKHGGARVRRRNPCRSRPCGDRATAVDLASPADLAVELPPAGPAWRGRARGPSTRAPSPAGGAQHQGNPERCGGDPKAAEQTSTSRSCRAGRPRSSSRPPGGQGRGNPAGRAATVVTNSRDQPSPSLTLKQVLSFSIPALAGIMTDPLMSFIDTACVGRMSSTELAAMGPNTAIYNFVLQIFTCFIVYTCGQVSKLSAKAEHDKVFKLVSHALFLGVTTGCVVAAGLIGFSYPLLGSIHAPELMGPAHLVPRSSHLHVWSCSAWAGRTAKRPCSWPSRPRSPTCSAT